MTKECGAFDYAGLFQNKLKQGVFLTSSFGGKTNTMIIGWGGINLIWGRPMMVVLIRHIRASHELVDKAREFTVSVPMKNGLAKEISVCGTKSFRDIGDKFAFCHLSALPGRKVAVPIVGECGLHYECRVLYQQDLNFEDIPENIKARYYSTRANHTVFYAEIMDSYTTEDDK
jgi:flavin reductase (DIM6/NTAB) family NADH-FMN oxidoreductase RutF